MSNEKWSLNTLVERLAEAKVLCIGDIMLDKFVYGEVNRISPEAPIPVLKTKSDKLLLGGAGNVANNLSCLGVETHFISVIGNDSTGKTITKLIKKIPNIEANLITVEKRPTTLKTRFIASGQQMMRVDDETTLNIDHSIESNIIDLTGSALDNCGALVLADYGKGVLTRSLLKQIIKLAKSRKIPVVIDPQGFDYSAYNGANLITPNLKELSEATTMPTGSDEEINAAAISLISKYKINSVLATRSGDGMSLIDKKCFTTFAAEAREIFDVSGAGDTVAATVSACLAANIKLDHGVKLANIAAGIVVAKLGTAVVYTNDIISNFRNESIKSIDKKLYTIHSITEQIEIWRSKGLKIGFTNGCFDILHPGHLSTITKAKSLCDKLIVGLNSDSSVKNLKGNNRPVQSEAARSKILVSLEDVDGVIIFNEKNPNNILKIIKPEIFVKGADYSIENIPEAKIIHSYGGDIILADIKDGFSTTNTISKINNNNL